MKTQIMLLLKLPLVFCLFILHTPAYGLEIYLNEWRSIYPDSNSDDIAIGIITPHGCQLCHQNDDGGDPWNPYGFEIRKEFLTNGNDINKAITTVQFDDNDGDGVESFDEIVRSYQPGWVEGANNSVFAANGDETVNQLPPTLPLTTGLDFPDSSEISDPISNIPPGAISIQLQEVSGGFNAPLKAVRAPGINGSLFVVEQTGKIFRVDLTTGDKTLFHDVGNDLVSLNLGGNDERGLLGLAFHPDFVSNGLFYTYQSEPRRTSQDTIVDFSTVAPDRSPDHRSMIVEYRASDSRCNSNISKRDTIMIIDQPQSNHNGGDLVFDQNNYLYVSLGDGGGANDQGPGHGLLGTGRNNSNVLGTILRIDPLGNNSDNGKYGIPADNPFLGEVGEDEIFAFGFRNPFRMSFDESTGDLYVADVGQNEIEEVDIVTSGGNYGWNWKEGSFFFYNTVTTGTFISTVAPPGLPNNLVDPIAQYDHDDGLSITGGYVYRGSQIPVLQGRYVFADFLRRLFYLDSSQNVLEFSGAGVSDFVAGFGQDIDNELYVLTRVDSRPSGTQGKLQKIMTSGAAFSAPDSGDESAICPPSDELCFPVRTTNGAIATICL